MTDERKPDPRAERRPEAERTPPDPQAEAERRLRMAIAAEARAEQRLRGHIQKGFYGCLTIFVLLFLLLLFFT